MPKSLEHDLSGVPETLLLTLNLRAMESQRPDALLKDENAVELVARLELEPGGSAEICAKTHESGGRAISTGERIRL